MNKLTMLLVEDNPADVVFFREAVQITGLAAEVEVVDNGEEALRFLRRQTRFALAPRPDVVVMDLNVPIKNGQEVLLEMASDPSLNTIRVAVLTTSASEICVLDLYPAGRCLYFSKTAEFAHLRDIVLQIAAHAAKEG